VQTRQTGFSLLEMLVAFSILSIAITILLNIFSSGVRYAAVAEDYAIATQVAESLMNRIGVEYPLESAYQEGLEQDKYHWQYRIEPYFLPIFETESTTEPAEDTGLFSVYVQVSWENGSDNRVIELQALKQEWQQKPTNIEPSITNTPNPFEALLQKTQ
jgi:general secretion pathway protein I